MNAQLKPAAFVACLLALSLLILLLLLWPGASSLPSTQAFSLQSIPSPTPPRAIPTGNLPVRPTNEPPDPISTKAALLTAVASQPTVLTPTPYVPPPHIALTSSEGGSYKTLHKKPPFTLEVSGYINSNIGKGKCRSAHWNWGDGTMDSTPCLSKEGALYTGRHTYTKYGTYYARLVMTLVGGEKASSDTQAVVIGSTFAEESHLRDTARWVVWGITLVGAVVILRRLRRVRTAWARVGFWLTLLLVFSYLPPFSYFPNPLGIYWSRVGGYSYDLRLPFWNGFVIAALPDDSLQQRLDGLIGAVGGLDPLDPTQPLTGYRFFSARLPERPMTYGNYAQIVTELTFADGTRRIESIPVAESFNVFGAYRVHSRSHRGGAFDNIGRLFTQHEEFGVTPFPWESAPIHLATPQRLDLHLDAQHWDRENPGNWVLAYGSERRGLAFSPDGNSFLAAGVKGYDKHDLWLIKLDGSPPMRIAEDVINYDWSPDGRYMIYNRAWRDFPVFVQELKGGTEREVAQPGVQQLSGMTQEGVWHVEGEELWVTPFDGGQKRQVTTVEGANNLTIALPSPDGRRVAYIYEGGLYLRNADEQGLGAPIARAQNAAWSPDGNSLAWVNEFSSLGVAERGGMVRFETSIGPTHTNLFHSVPLWSPDGRTIFVQTFPNGGRRIV